MRNEDAKIVEEYYLNCKWKNARELEVKIKEYNGSEGGDKPTKEKNEIEEKQKKEEQDIKLKIKKSINFIDEETLDRILKELNAGEKDASKAKKNLIKAYYYIESYIKNKKLEVSNPLKFFFKNAANIINEDTPLNSDVVPMVFYDNFRVIVDARLKELKVDKKSDNDREIKAKNDVPLKGEETKTTRDLSNTSEQLKESKELRYKARRNKITNKITKEDVIKICKDLVGTNIDNTTKLLLGQALKHAVKNGMEIEVKKLIEILEVLEKNDKGNAKLASEIIYAFGYKLKNSKELISVETINKIRKFINANENMPAKVKDFLNMQLQSQYSISGFSLNRINSNRKKPSAGPLKKGPQAIVTKNQQTIKVNVKNNQSEESKINISNLEAELSKNKKIKISATAEILPKVEESKSGSDRGWLEFNYRSIKKLYVRARENMIIKDDDLDFLYKKFIGDTNKGIVVHWGQEGELTSLFMDRMIAEIFCRISANQNLTSSGIISDLFRCVDNFTVVKKAICGDYNSDQWTDWIRWGDEVMGKVYENEPTILAEAARRLYQCWNGRKRYNINCYDSKAVMEVICSEVNKIRLDALRAIHNLVLRDKTVITRPGYLEKIKAIQKSQDVNDKPLKVIAQKVLLHVNDNIMDKEDVVSCLVQMEEENSEFLKEGKEFIDKLLQQTNSSERCEKLFDENVILRISFLLTKHTLNPEIRIQCCAILNNYLKYPFAQSLDLFGLDPHQRPR